MLSFVVATLDFIGKIWQAKVDAEPSISVTVTETVATQAGERVVELHAENLNIDEFIDLRTNLPFEFCSDADECLGQLDPVAPAFDEFTGALPSLPPIDQIEDIVLDDTDGFDFADATLPQDDDGLLG